MLTQKQEKYVQELIKGKTQREAYKQAYPNSKKYKDKSIDELASKLFKNNKVKSRYDELNERHKEKAIMTRGELLEGLKKGFYMALGIEATPTTVKAVIGGEMAMSYHEILNADLKALSGIAEKIAKLEGWDKQVETTKEEKLDKVFDKIKEALNG